MNPIPIIQGALLGDTLAVLYKVPTTDLMKTKVVCLTSMRLCNTSATARKVTVHIVPPDETPTPANRRFDQQPVEAAGEEDSSAFFVLNDALLPGTTIRAFCDAANAVAISVNGASYP